MDKDKQIELLQDLCIRQREEIEALKKLIPKGNAKRSGKTSDFKGVSFDKKQNMWRVQMRIANKVRFLGSFPPTPEGERDAAKCYQDAKANKSNLEKQYFDADKKKNQERIDFYKKDMPELQSAKNMSAADVFGS